MISVDRRAGSKDLYSPLKKLGLPVTLTTLEFGDLAFMGVSGLVGIEHKKPGDLVNSLLTKRLTGHQLPGMVRTYPHRWLLIEGGLKPGPDDRILEHRYGNWEPMTSRLTYSQLEGWLLTLEILTGLHIKTCFSRAESVAFITTLFHWWQKPLEKHHAHIPTGAKQVQDQLPGAPIDVSGDRPTLCHQVAATLPGVGYVRGRAVAEAFGTVCRMAGATRQEWESVPGVGKVTAQRVYRALRGWEVKP